MNATTVITAIMFISLVIAINVIRKHKEYDENEKKYILRKKPLHRIFLIDRVLSFLVLAFLIKFFLSLNDPLSQSSIRIILPLLTSAAVINMLFKGFSWGKGNNDKRKQKD